MKYKIDSKENEIHVEIVGVRGRREKLMEAFQECEEGRCTCPTQEYSKLDSLEMEIDEDAIRLKIKSKSDEKIDEAEIKKCLEYTRGKVANKD